MLLQFLGASLSLAPRSGEIAAMPYDDDDDLFNHEFDFVDDDDDAKDKAKGDDESKPRPRGPAPRGRGKEKADGDKPPARGPKRAGPARPRRAPDQKSPPSPPMDPAPVGYLMDDEAPDDVDNEPAEMEADAQPAVPAGPPADHLVHIYEYGHLKRTVGRKFTDEEAVSFAEELTRTGKAYGRYAIAASEDEEPDATFASPAKD